MPPNLAFQMYGLASETPVLARQIGGVRASLVLLEDRDNLLFGESCSLHQSVLIRAGL